MAIKTRLSSFEMVIGLEVHIALHTKSKLFCGCSTVFNAPPNSHCCPVCIGMPGALPVMNQKALDLAITAGLITHCYIHSQSQMARKHYFYPDCPKGYQITQGDMPLCEKGSITIFPDTQNEKDIQITRIHIEEDAGKSIHDSSTQTTFIDYNRCGIPLIEVVSAPMLSSAEEAVAYLKTLRLRLLYAGVTQGKMNEGDMRCDVNISLKSPNSSVLGQRTEIKNLNSFQSVFDAISAEYERQSALLSAEKTVVAQTMGFDQKNKAVFLLREKETADDYHYIVEPDLPFIKIESSYIEKLKKSLPMMPEEKYFLLVNKYGLTHYQASQLIEGADIANYFLKAAQYAHAKQTLANLILTDIFALLPETSTPIPISPFSLAKVAQLLSEDAITSTTGKKLIALLWNEDIDPLEYVKEHNFFQINDREILQSIVLQVLDNNPQMIDQYKKGKTNVLKSLLGKAMSLTQGKGNPKILEALFIDDLIQH